MIEQVEKILLRIKELREAKNLTHGNMLTDVTVKSASAYSKIEKSKNITVYRLLEISKALDVDITTWFKGLEQDQLVMKDDVEKYGKDGEKGMHDIYLLVNELKREILLLKKEIAGIKPPAKIKKPASKSS